LLAKLIYSLTKSTKVVKCFGGCGLNVSSKKKRPFSASSFKSYAKQ
jgi:hypothetical protein